MSAEAVLAYVHEPKFGFGQSGPQRLTSAPAIPRWPTAGTDTSDVSPGLGALDLDQPFGLGWVFPSSILAPLHAAPFKSLAKATRQKTL